MRLNEHLMGAVGPVLRYQALCKKCKAANTKNSSLHVTRDANQLWRTKSATGLFRGKKKWPLFDQLSNTRNQFMHQLTTSHLSS
jgi:hypothetical protein